MTVPYRDAQKLAARREEFEHTTSAGFWEDTRESWWGRDLPEEFQSALNEAIHLGDTYVIVSYDIPIAFSQGDTFMMNPRGYSPTTKKQQDYYRESLAKNFTERNYLA